ncbi:hypothetical protein BC829DRAFT_418538 [Chytridium lagenaria]|nr:hypothetical protein BC829DRAFT_418538 [Chytridium lagenaria]
MTNAQEESVAIPLFSFRRGTRPTTTPTATPPPASPVDSKNEPTPTTPTDESVAIPLFSFRRGSKNVSTPPPPVETKPEPVNVEESVAIPLFSFRRGAKGVGAGTPPPPASPVDEKTLESPCDEVVPLFSFRRGAKGVVAAPAVLGERVGREGGRESLGREGPVGNVEDLTEGCEGGGAAVAAAGGATATAAGVATATSAAPGLAPAAEKGDEGLMGNVEDGRLFRCSRLGGLGGAVEAEEVKVDGGEVKVGAGEVVEAPVVETVEIEDGEKVDEEVYEGAVEAIEEEVDEEVEKSVERYSTPEEGMEKVEEMVVEVEDDDDDVFVDATTAPAPEDVVVPVVPVEVVEVVAAIGSVWGKKKGERGRRLRGGGDDDEDGGETTTRREKGPSKIVVWFKKMAEKLFGERKAKEGTMRRGPSGGREEGGGGGEGDGERGGFEVLEKEVVVKDVVKDVVEDVEDVRGDIREREEKIEIEIEEDVERRHHGDERQGEKKRGDLVEQHEKQHGQVHHDDEKQHDELYLGDQQRSLNDDDEDDVPLGSVGSTGLMKKVRRTGSGHSLARNSVSSGVGRMGIAGSGKVKMRRMSKQDLMERKSESGGWDVPVVTTPVTAGFLSLPPLDFVVEGGRIWWEEGRWR